MAELWRVGQQHGTEVIPKNGTDFTLEEMQGYVGGYIEIVGLNDGRLLVVNEEGKLDGLPINRGATAIWEANHGRTDIIVGDALVCDSNEVR